MKAALHSLILSLAVLLALDAEGGAFSAYPQIGFTTNLDILLVDQSNAPGPTYGTKTITVDAFLKSAVVTNAQGMLLSNALVQSNYVFAVGGSSTNQSINHGHLFTTNGYLVAWGSLSGTNGNNWFAVNCSNANTDFSNVNVMDTIILAPGGVETNIQFLVSATTNANRTIGVIYNVPGNWTNVPFWLFSCSLALHDSQPHLVGGISGQAQIGVTSFSTGNNGGNSGGYYFMDGFDSASILNNGGSPDYLGFSVGIGRGSGYGNQFVMQSGCQFNDLMILGNDWLGVRTGFTNAFGNAVQFASPTYLQQLSSFGSGARFYGTNTQSPVPTISGTINSHTFTGSSAFNGMGLGDTIFPAGGGTYVVTHWSASTVTVDQPLSANYSSVAFTYTPAQARCSDNAGDVSMALSQGGAFVTDNSQDNAAGLLLTSGGDYGATNTWQIKADDSQDVLLIGTTGVSGRGSQIVISPYSQYNSLLIDAGSILECRGLTNQGGGALNIGTGVQVAGAGTISSGSVTPNSNVSGKVGDIYTWTGGSSGTTLWVKESGNNTTTGWVGK